jgi:hypothetical protein
MLFILTKKPPAKFLAGGKRSMIEIAPINIIPYGLLFEPSGDLHSMNLLKMLLSKESLHG